MLLILQTTRLPLMGYNDQYNSVIIWLKKTFEPLSGDPPLC